MIVQAFPTTAGQVPAWTVTQPWFAALRATPQDPVWHAEGDVGVHTELVMQACLELEGPKRLELLLAAALHDVAKTRCTETGEDGRIHAPGHSRLGARMAHSLLWGALPPPQRHLVVELVRLHATPLHAWDSDADLARSATASHAAPLALLRDLADADLRGRRCLDPDDSAPLRLELWWEQVGQWPSPYPFPHPQTGRDAFEGVLPLLPTAAPRLPPFRCQVHLLCGLPGAGKDTYAARNLPDLPMISLDRLRQATKARRGDPKAEGRLLQEAQHRFREHLAASQSFVFNATNLTRAMRQKWLSIAAAYNAELVGHYIEPSREKLLTQNRERDSAIPEDALLELFGKLEVPHPLEFHQAHYEW